MDKSKPRITIQWIAPGRWKWAAWDRHSQGQVGEAPSMIDAFKAAQDYVLDNPARFSEVFER